MAPTMAPRSDSRSPQIDPLVSSRVVNGSEDVAERAPLLGDSVPRKKFYRARPLWLVPFAIIAALVRGMTLAPRVEVFTQLACSQLVHPEHTLTNPPFPVGLEPISLLFEQPWDDEDSIPKPPASQCKSDTAVQAGAARIQTVYAMTMGLLSALTTGWWGHFGDRHGRMKVFAITSFGWFLTDVTFILAATPSSPLASSGETLILIAPVFEGLFGGWSTIQSVTAAYVSDCTSSGSRSSVFSRFTGVSFLGFALGPVVGAWLIRHPIALIAGRPIPGQPSGQSVISVFWVAALGSFINFCLVLFVFPESVSKDQHRVSRTPRDTAVDAASPDRHKDGITTFIPRIIRDFFSPLATFIPTSVSVDGRQRRDWSLTFLACALFGHLLSAGLYQIKYLYGSHVYSWTPEQLSYYISFMGGGRALYLLFVLPLVISRFKPKSNLPRPPPGATGAVSKQKPTKEHLAREMKFDLTVARVSLCIDLVANAAIVLAPAPADGLYTNAFSGSTDEQFRRSQALFVAVSWTAAWGAGLVPAAQSLALCIVQWRALVAAERASESGSDAAPAADAQAGKLLGALAILQATGQMIFGPMLFGLVYYNTVATFPKAVFVTAMGMLLAALLATFLVRTPLPEASKAVLRAPLEGEEEEGRGRPRTSKDLGRASGSGSGYGSTSNAVSMQEPASPST